MTRFMTRFSSRRSRRDARTDRRARRARRGFTVVEAMVAILVLSVGVLGLASTAGAIAKQMGGSRRQMRAASLVRMRVERLGAVSTCATVAAAGTTVTGTATSANGIVERYTITGGAMVLTVLDSVTIPPLKKPVVIQSAIRCG